MFVFIGEEIADGGDTNEAELSVIFAGGSFHNIVRVQHSNNGTGN
jgi:hypothetical protein